MNNISTDKAPSIGVVVPHFISAGFAFLILAVLIFFSTDSFFGHYYQGRLLAITHLTALGWITMIIFGALYQLIPVVFEVGLYSEKLAKLSHRIFLIGLVGMVVAFWQNSFKVYLPIFSTITFFALIGFAVNILLSVWSAKKQQYSAKFIVSSVVWLLSTAILGIMMALNHYFNYLPGGVQLLKVHAHIGVIGWFLQLIIGVASVLVPMFLVSHNQNHNKLKYAYSFINIGLILMVLEWMFPINHYINSIFVGLVVVGVLFFLSFVFETYQQKIRKLDVGMRLSTVSFFGIFIPLIFGIALSINYFVRSDIPANFATLYGFTIFFAFVTPLILGQTYKTLPFLVWLHRYQPYVGKMKIPMPGDLFSTKIAEAHLWTYVVAVFMMSIGIFLSSAIVTKIGAVFLVVTALLYIYNMYLTMTHKVELKPLFAPKEERSLKDLLKTVIDPEVEINIVDMGLIYKLEYDGTKNVDIEMTLSTPNCPVGDSIVLNVMETIMAEHPDYEVNVNLVFEPKWSPSLISEAGKKVLEAGHRWLE